MRRFIYSLIIALACGAARGEAAEPQKSVVQIFTFSQTPVFDAPWRFDQVRRSGGTGFVIKGKKIMTNAHVVSWAKQILVRRYQDPRPYQATVKFVGHDCDLAIIDVDDPDFFVGLEPLDFGPLPPVRSGVVTFGYPAGGEQISYTKGVVSRIEVQTYAHIGNRSFLAVQTDAAINPGNSGGPVVQDEKVVGVAFQGMQGLENTGFFIPTPVIQHFLKDIDDGAYHGFPSAGIRATALQNPAYRKALGLANDSRGCRIDGLIPKTKAEGVLKEDDVLLQIGPYPVGSDCTILYQSNRVHLAAAIQEVQSGESLPLKIWRQNKEMDVSLPVEAYEIDRTTGNSYDKLPRYYVYAGLVFTPLSLDYMKTLGRNWADAASAELVYELIYRRSEAPATVRSEPIVLATTLADAVNANLAVKARALVDKINGQRIERLEDVIQALESGTNAQHTIEFAPKLTFECLDRQAAAAANATILKNYGIAKDRRL